MATGNDDGSIVLQTRVDDSGLKKGLGTLGKLGDFAKKSLLAIGAAAGAATVAVTKMAVTAYADYEQLVGGVETLFKGSSQKVIEYAHQAFATTGQSANEYMQNVTSFSASLLSAVGGDTDKAAEIANEAMISMSDNANKMGSSMESVQMAFQGFAKQQYMLLDNLKLGYGGTKTEMERLLKDAQAITGVEYNIDNLADVYTAIGVIQEKLGIAGTTAKEAESTISGSLGMVKASWQNLLIAMSGGGDFDKSIDDFVYSLEKFTANISPVIERTLLGLGQALQKALPMLVQTVVSALIQQIPNLVAAIYSMIVGLFKGIAQGIKALFTGQEAKNVEAVEDAVEQGAEDAEKMAENMGKTAEATKEAGKEAKKTLAAFDEINVLTSGNETESETPTLDMTSGTDGGIVDTQELEQGESQIDETLNNIMATAGEVLLAIGLLLLFFGQIAWGIGFIIAGALSFEVAAYNSSKSGISDEVISMLLTIMGIAGGALLAIGIMLLWLGVTTGVAIGMIVAGALLIIGSVVTKAAFNPDDIKGWLSLILGIAAGALLALGIILVMVGSVPIGVGLIIAGAVALVSAIALDFEKVKGLISGWVAKIMIIVGAALIIIGLVLVCTGVALGLGIALIAVGAIAVVTPIALHWDEFVNRVSTFLKENQGLVVGVSLALLVLGIILCCTGVALPLGIGLIAVGAAGLAAVAAINWNTIKDTITETFNAIIDWIKTYGLLVVGIILCLTGVGIPLGIALIIKWAQEGEEKGVPLATAIVDKVKEIWEAVKDFWDKNIAPIFTAEWWANLGKTALNGLIETFEDALNFIIEMVNVFIRGIDSVVGAIGDIFGGDWGVATIPKVSIPRLAQGAVIPPNKEFLAVLGDQKHGTNIEAPLQTIVDAFNIALNQRGEFGGNSNGTLVIEVDGYELGRVALNQIRRENSRVGATILAN